MSASNKNPETTEVTAEIDDLHMSDRPATSVRLLPSVGDLLRGRPFLDDDLLADKAAFAEVTMRQLDALEYDPRGLSFALRRLTAAASAGDFLIAASSVEAAVTRSEGEFRSSEEMAARCHFDAAVCGHPDSARKVAAYAVSRAYSSELPPDTVREQVAGAVAWLLVAAGQRRPPDAWTRQSAAAFQ